MVKNEYNSIIEVISEIDLYPFGIYLNLSGTYVNEANITNFINYGYNDSVTVDLNLNVHRKVSLLPGFLE